MMLNLSAAVSPVWPLKAVMTRSMGSVRISAPMLPGAQFKPYPVKVYETAPKIFTKIR
ncbi:MAG: hypothetical protein R3C68_19935 [Myxococcota bacterium]